VNAIKQSVVSVFNLAIVLGCIVGSKFVVSTEFLEIVGKFGA